jgi:carbamoyl-phosphate synthase large subunit
MPDTPSKVLVIGSGPIVIGQAAEFDYAGTQACRALREEGVTTVLVNSNPATIMTDEGIADIVYIEPLAWDVLERIIARERPDGLLPTLGGQTGLNMAVELAERGILEKYDVRLLGTPLEAIRRAEDRELFRQLLHEIGEPAPPSATVTSVTEAGRVASELGLPLVVRPAYTLGGTGGGIVRHQNELESAVRAGLAASPIGQVLLERSLLGWKEIEYEVMRDGADNCIVVCNMENLDPMGVHTGDSIVVAPSQTLTDKEYQLLRTASLNIIRALGVEGGCNVQLALAPNAIVAETLPEIARPKNSQEYYVIEVNPRVSRSSALASKATGYPIARVAARIAVGKRLDEIRNAVTQKTMAAFEPALDYCVVKMPTWPFDKFPTGDRELGTQMKATGEAMAIDRTFEAALQKVVRSLEIGGRTLLWEAPEWKDLNDWRALPLATPSDQRLWVLVAALRRGATPEDLSRASGVDPWFTHALGRIAQMEADLRKTKGTTRRQLWEAKRMGFSDAYLAAIGHGAGSAESVRRQRLAWGFRPVYKMVDTCAAEFEADTPYFYSTYEQENEAAALAGPKAVVIGSGPIRIAQGIEFDYCSVHAAWALQKEGVQSIMINSNPETVSTDFDISARLYFGPLDEESVRDILENENWIGKDEPPGETPSIVQFGGQTAIDLSQTLDRVGLPILGSSAATIDIASDRRRFEGFLAALDIPRPPGTTVTKIEEALEAARDLGYPVLVRPSYVLGGRAMEIVQTPEELRRYIALGIEASPGRPVLIDKYFEGKECDVDAVCDGETVLVPGLMEHIERAGVHSGDSMAVYPGLTLTDEEERTLVDYTVRIGLALQVKGLMNIQFVIMDGDSYAYRSHARRPQAADSKVYVIEVNPRASRTVPFLSKVTGVPMVALATRAMLGRKLEEFGYQAGLYPRQNLVAVKAPVFSMAKLTGVDSYLGPEMRSTGEVMGLDHDVYAAMAKALLAAGLDLPPRGDILLSIADRHKAEAAPLIRSLVECGYGVHATAGTASFLHAEGLGDVKVTNKLGQGTPNVEDLIRSGQVQAVVNTVSEGRGPIRDGFYIRRAAVERRIPCYTSLDTLHAAVEVLCGRGTRYNVKRRTEYLDSRE